MANIGPEFTEQQSSCVCNGVGSYCVTEGTGRVRGFSTYQCVCRKDLPRREGKASWWGKETIFERVIAALLDSFTVTVEPEVPYSQDNYTLVRRGNRYYPTFVEIDYGNKKAMLFPDEARKLAQAIIEAADLADITDHSDVDTCGHWAPCDCGKAKATA